MPRLFSRLSFVLALSALASGSALAEVNCGDILKYGVFEIDSREGQAASEEAFRNYVCNEDSHQTSRKFDGSYIGWGDWKSKYDEASADFMKYCAENSG